MTGLASLWLPILLSAIVVFVASSIIHTVVGWHHADHRHLDTQDQLLDALRGFNIPAGDYLLPRPKNREDLASPEFQARSKRGPIVLMTVMSPDSVSMPANLAKWFVYCLAMGLLAAYVAGSALPPGTGMTRVFQLTGATAFIAYAAALWQSSIWYQRAWTTTIKSTVDGLIYGIVTAAVFAYFWPR